MTYLDALAVFVTTDTAYDGGLSNHGPMAAEALVSMGAEQWIGPFVDDYRTRLEPPTATPEPVPGVWREWLHVQLPGAVPMAANLAGHGLLRVAHAVRGIERVETAAPGSDLAPVQRFELTIALDYWTHGGPGLDGVQQVDGILDADTWAAGLPRLRPEERSDGFLTNTLETAAATHGFASAVATLAPGENHGATLDALALVAADSFCYNTGLAAFALLHGTTVPTMARVLLPHLDESDRDGLVAAVAGFVAAAIIGFDGPRVTTAAPTTGLDVSDLAGLADAAGATLEDHTIKFADACLGLSARTGSSAQLAALHRQITNPYGAA